MFCCSDGCRREARHGSGSPRRQVRAGQLSPAKQTLAIKEEISCPICEFSLLAASVHWPDDPRGRGDGCELAAVSKGGTPLTLSFVCCFCITLFVRRYVTQTTVGTVAEEGLLIVSYL